MSWQARVFHADSGQFLAALRVGGRDMREAEGRATSKVALLLRADPSKLLVRHLAQLAEPRRATP